MKDAKMEIGLPPKASSLKYRDVNVGKHLLDSDEEDICYLPAHADDYDDDEEEFYGGWLLTFSRLKCVPQVDCMINPLALGSVHPLTFSQVSLFLKFEFPSTQKLTTDKTNIDSMFYRLLPL